MKADVCTCHGGLLLPTDEWFLEVGSYTGEVFAVNKSVHNKTNHL